MTGSTIRRTLAAALLIGIGATALAASPTVHAQSVPPSAAPTTFDSSHPTVSGILVAKPQGNEGNVHTACDNQASPNAVTRVRGIIVCSDQGKYILVQINRYTGFYARYWGKYTLAQFRDGDHVNVWGVLRDGGILVRPTYAVQDTDLQEAFTDSQDFIMSRDHGRLQLGVLKSDADGPVQGIVYADHNGRAHVTLCNGDPGTWANLTKGKTIDVTLSLFNRRLNTYTDTDTVKIISCP